MAKSINRRLFSIGSAALVAGAATLPVSFAGERSGIISVRFNGADRLKGLSGADLRSALARSLSISVEGDLDAIEATLIAVRVGADRDVDIFESRPMVLRRGVRGWRMRAFLPNTENSRAIWVSPALGFSPAIWVFPGIWPFRATWATRRAARRSALQRLRARCWEDQVGSLSWSPPTKTSSPPAPPFNRWMPLSPAPVLPAASRP